jgi:hypothetical protein
MRSLYFKIFSVSFFITFLPPGIATSISIHVPFSYSGLWRLVYCWGWFCRFALVDSIIRLPCPLYLFLLTLVHVHTRVHCLILPLTPYVCWSVIEHTLHHVAWLLLLLLLLLLFLLLKNELYFHTFTTCIFGEIVTSKHPPRL